MNYFERYKAINTPYGNQHSDHVINYSKESAKRIFLQSPTLTNVEVNNTPNVPSIVSIYQKDFFDRTFLLEPDSQYAVVGNYFKYKNYTYLIMKSNDNEIYPNLYGKLCNEDFLVPIETKKIKVQGTRGDTYKFEHVTEKVPIVVDVKGYSIADNAILPLTEGRVVIYMQFKPLYVDKVKLNYEFELFNDAYKITDIQLDKVINDTGYIVLSAQKVVESNGS